MAEILQLGASSLEEGMDSDLRIPTGTTGQMTTRALIRQAFYDAAVSLSKNPPCVYTYIYIHRYLYIYMYVYMCIYIYVYTRSCLCTYADMLYSDVGACVYIYMYVHAHQYLRIYIYVYIHIYIYIDMHVTAGMFTRLQPPISPYHLPDSGEQLLVIT